MHIFSTAHPACDHSKSVNSFLQSTHLTELNRERALGGSRRGVKRSWREALIMPPASHPTELLTRKSVILQDRSSLPSFVGNQDYLPMGRTFGRVSPRSKNLAFLPWGSSLLGGWVALPQWSLVKTPHLDLKQGTPSDFGTTGRVGELHLSPRKNLPK